MSATEGAKNLAQQGDTNVSKPRKQSTLVFDATKDTVKTHSSQRITSRKRKRAKPRSALLTSNNHAYTSMCKRETKFHKHKGARHRMRTAAYIFSFANLSKLSNGEYNDTHPLAFAAGNLTANPNILGHRDAMKAGDAECFHESMKEEMGNCQKNKIYELMLRNNVPKAHNILRTVWSHRRKTTPDGRV